MKLTKYSLLGMLMPMIMVCLLDVSLMADGRFLRGDKWQRFSVEEAKADFFVAPNGNDNWSGTLAVPNALKNDGPFATIERAQKAVRLLKKQVYTKKKKVEDARYVGSPYKYGAGKDILVLIRGGNYYLTKPLVFKPDDGGERCETDLPSGAFEFHKLKDYFVTYAAYPGETPVISGGRKITSWQKQGGIWVASVKGIDVVKLIADGREQKLARIPNEGYFTPAVMPEKTTEFKFRAGDLKNWGNMEHNKIHLVLRWHKGENSIASIDEQNHIAYLKEPQPGLVHVPPRYYVENIKALLDAPGEWFFDRKETNLYYLPDEEIDDPNSARIIAPILSRLVDVKGKADAPVRNLRLYGLTFDGSIAGDHTISFTYAKNCELVDSEVRNTGGIAIYVGKGCYRNRILNNTILNADGGGIAVMGNPHPEKWNDVVRETIVSYNYVSHCGGNSIGAHNTLYTTISHNEITNSRGRYAMNVGGWNNIEEALEGGYRVEYNHLHHVQDGADDSGAITCSGLTHDSIIRYNLIHDVIPGYFNDNVAFWFDNMSAGWTVENNIYYNLQQGEMKLCACYLEDNIYRDNFLIEPPAIAPEGIIKGEPQFSYSDIEIVSLNNDEGNVTTGQRMLVKAHVTNSGATGVGVVHFYVDRKIVASRKFPLIRHNRREISFTHYFYEPGEHTVAIGDAPYVTLNVSGESLDFLFGKLNLSRAIVPAGEDITARINIENVRDGENTTTVDLYLNDSLAASKALSLAPKEKRELNFTIKPAAGIYQVRINHLSPVSLMVYPHHTIPIEGSDLNTYCSGTAKPCDFDVDQTRNRFKIIVHGTDFYHAEDSYGAIYLQDGIKGNFIVTVQVTRFGENVTEWFRAGIFVRNDMTHSYETEPGSLGSVLMFTTPKRFGMQWDEFGDGCMHKASSRNYKEKISRIWLKLERVGDTFFGYISYDGENWLKYGETGPVPGVADVVHVGMAAGANNQAPSLVEFENFQLEVENINRSKKK